MTTLLDLLAAVSWWAMLFTFAVVASVATLAVFFHAFPNDNDNRKDHR